MGANWVGSNSYEIGQTVEAKTAQFTGGKEPVIYRYRFQFKPTGDDVWTNGKWETVPNEKTSVFYECVEAGDLKLQAQARDAQDPVKTLNSNTGVKNIPAAPMVVGESILTGEPYVGETLTASQPSVTGGVAPYGFSYMSVSYTHLTLPTIYSV